MKRQEKNKTLFIILFSILAIAIILYLKKQNTENIVTINGKKILIEIADSPEEHQQGLMFRTSLKENRGMLFIFEQPSAVAFWMKNTLIPLDIIFIDGNNRITDIQTAHPCTADPCPTYKPTQQILYVLEVNAGFAEKNNINVGDKVEINLKEN